MKRIDDSCARPVEFPYPAQRSSSAPIFPAAAYLCNSPEVAAELMSGQAEGYIYQRDGHPNADMFAELCREMHGGDEAIVTNSGMAALSLAMLALVKSGDHLVISNQLYGRSTQLFKEEAPRLDIQISEVDTTDIDEVRTACRDRTRLVVAETITNPLLRISDVKALAGVARACGAALLIDNTFASPAVCQPLRLGADLVMESVTKMINGHGDVTLGLLCGRRDRWDRIAQACSTWGFTSGPFDCWLASRGLATLHLRMERASSNAQKVAEFLQTQDCVESVIYPGLEMHPDHLLARRQFTPAEIGGSGGEALPGRFGSMVTFTLSGDLPAATGFIAAVAKDIPFCPSLGEISTTLSHPASTSHRGLSSDERRRLGIGGGTIRLSVGVQSPEMIVRALQKALSGLDERFAIDV